MAKTLKVNRAQVRAARLIVSRASRGLGEASAAVRAIAQAQPVAPAERTALSTSQRPRD